MTWDEIQGKLDLLQENLTRLDELAALTEDEFHGDFRNLDSALHRLQTTIQALVDLGAWVVARLQLPAPRTSRDILETLERSGRLAPGTTDRLGPMVAFRDRVVHLYDRVDPKIAYRILQDHRQDLRELLDLLLAAAE